MRDNRNRNKRKNSGQNNRFLEDMQKKLVVLFIMVLLAFVGLSVRIIYIYNENGDKYKKQILSQQAYDSSIIPYERGTIYDANMIQLATSKKVYNVILDAKILSEVLKNNGTESYEASIQALVTCFGLESVEIKQYISDNPTSQYYRLKKGIEYKEVETFLTMQEEAAKTSKKGSIVGVWFEDEYERVYPNGSLASHVLGFASKDNVGMYGLEEYYNTTLNGTDGREYGYLNSNELLERTTISAMDGNSLVTSIDMNIQKVVEKYILEFNEEHRGEYREDDLGSSATGVVVMDPNSGRVLAMASYPDFDPNDPYNLSDYYEETEIETMDHDTQYGLLNEIWRNFCIFDTYEPGSTAKLMTVAAGLEYGAITGNEVYNCTGSYTVSGHPDPIHCANIYGHGPLNVSQSIEQSCNVAMMEMVMSIGMDDFMQTLENCNIGLKTNIDLQGESRTDTLVFDPEKMVPTDLAIASFGQGYNVTMIQLATAFSSLINGGNYYQPQVVTKIVSENGSTLENIEPRILKQTISEATSKKIIEYCDATVAVGLGQKARPAGYTMGGKTGTAEKYPRGTGNYVVSFIGYAPAVNPEVLIYVVIDEPNVEQQDKSAYAMEVSKKIMGEILPYLNIFQTEELTEDELADLEAQQETEENPEGNLEEENSEGGNSEETNQEESTIEQ